MRLYCFMPPSRQQAGQDQSLPKKGRYKWSAIWHSATCWFCLTCFLQCSHHSNFNTSMMKLTTTVGYSDPKWDLATVQCPFLSGSSCPFAPPFTFVGSTRSSLRYHVPIQVRYQPFAFSLRQTPLRHTQQATIVDHHWYRSSKRRSLSSSCC